MGRPVEERVGWWARRQEEGRGLQDWGGKRGEVSLRFSLASFALHGVEDGREGDLPGSSTYPRPASLPKAHLPRSACASPSGGGTGTSHSLARA